MTLHPAPKLVLASASPRREALLAQIGVTPDSIIVPAIDETPRLRELPNAYARRVAREKALAVAASETAALVLAADTVVACGRRILPKATSEAEARKCLELLSGRAHRVLTAICLVASARLTERLVETRVVFKRLSQNEIEAYLASGEWQGKAGGYAIQGHAGTFIRLLTGSYSSVVGLPLYETANLLTGAGFVLAPRRI
jgi:septum formation protein